MTLVRLTLAILILAGVASANASYQQIDTTDFVNRATTYEGQLVVVTGQVCAVNADGKSLRLFDADSKALIDVSLLSLQRNQRRAVMINPFHRLSVYGGAEVRNGKLIITAHRVVAQPAAGDTTSAAGR